jgi:hypothetical protein
MRLGEEGRVRGEVVSAAWGQSLLDASTVHRAKKAPSAHATHQKLLTVLPTNKWAPSHTIHLQFSTLFIKSPGNVTRYVVTCKPSSLPHLSPFFTFKTVKIMNITSLNYFYFYKISEGNSEIKNSERKVHRQFQILQKVPIICK